MSGIAVHSEGLGKRYPIGGAPRSAFRYKSLREAIVRRAGSPLGPRRGANDGSFWALRGLNFEVAWGEAVGIIGRNGAGKSTLLKILSRITDPTEGFVDLWGRVGSLLEVGTGFHPELSGRENIYLNGAILGMKTAEIAAKFDEIVAFAEVEKFLDTPVKHYSSGMFVRLAFAVAAHLEPEILVIDEVLAVGDASFQRKCLGKMSEVGRQGRTILFVSHNMQAVRQLCGRALLLEGGRAVRVGASAEVIHHYLASVAGTQALEAVSQAISELPEDPVFRMKSVRVLQDGRPLTEVVSGKPISVDLAFEVLQETVGLHITLQLLDVEGTLLFESIHNGDEDEIPRVLAGHYIARATIPGEFLAPASYELLVLAGIHGVRSLMPRALRVSLAVTGLGRVNRAYPGYRTPGRLAPLLDWKTERTEG